MWTWEAGTYSGVTDHEQRAFAHAAQYVPASGADRARVAQVRLVYQLSTLHHVYQPCREWTGHVINGRLEWQRTATSEHNPWEQP